MGSDYLIRIAGVREVLADIASGENRMLEVDDWGVLDEAETETERRLLGGYTDVWIEWHPQDHKREFGSPGCRLVGVRVHGASGDTYQALMPTGHPRSPLRMTGGDAAIAEAFEIMRAEIARNPIAA